MYRVEDVIGIAGGGEIGGLEVEVYRDVEWLWASFLPAVWSDGGGEMQGVDEDDVSWIR